MKSNVSVLVFGAIIAFGFFSGCYNGDVTSQERAVGEFTGIELAGTGDVNVHFGEEFKVIVTTDSNVQGKVVTRVERNTLCITQRSGPFYASELTIDVFMPEPELRAISLIGTGSFRVASGNATELDISLSGTGDINAQYFQVEKVTVTHSGVGDAKIWATNTLHGNLSGVGDILYRGSPTVTVKKSGSGVGHVGRLRL